MAQVVRKVGDKITGQLYCPYCKRNKSELVYVGKINPQSVWACTECAPELRDMPAKDAE